MKRAPAPVIAVLPSAPRNEYDPSRHASWSARREPPRGEVLLAGYRVVRRLASGPRADVYLGHSSTPGVPPVALKVFRPEANSESIEREIHTLCEAQGGRFVHLIDLATLPDARVCLVLERLDPRSLGRILQDRPCISPGEAVTILAPIVATLADLHEHGLAHSSLDLGSVLLHASGRPVLAGLGSLRDLPDLPSARISLLREDYNRLAALLQGVLGHLDASSGLTVLRRAERLIEDFRAAARSTPFLPCLGELERSLFDWSVPAPLRLNAGESAGTPGQAEAPGPSLLPFPVLAPGESAALSSGAAGYPAGRPGRHRQPVPDPATGAPIGIDTAWTWQDPSPYDDDLELRPAAPKTVGSGTAPAGRLLRGAQLTARIRTRALGLVDAQPVLAARRRIVRGLRARRRPLLILGLVAASGVVLALTLIPAGGEAGRGQDIGATTVAVAPEVSAPPDVMGDDPTLAVTALLTLRSACRESASIVCLDGVDQSGSAAMAADSYDVWQAQQGGLSEREPAYASWPVTLVERTGNMALVALAPADAGADGKPASVLVVKGEAGWRLREIFTY